jgi:lambda family phage portal protein
MEVDVKLRGHPAITVRENMIDRVVRYFSPGRAQQRLRSRVSLALAGGYVGARKDRRQTISWKTSGNDPDSDLLLDLPTLRERSRDLERNNPLAAGTINTNCTSIVGTGLTFHSRIDREVLGMTEDEADAWEKNSQRWFRQWAESQECDAARTQWFAEQQDLALRSTLVNGDVFALMPYIKRSGSRFRLKVQLVEADRVCNEKNMSDTDTLAGGVKKDTNGAPAEYHILKQHPGRIYGRKAQEWDKIPAFGTKTGRRNVIHLYRMLRPGQTRGVPYLAPVIETLKQLGQYTEAELMAAVVSGMFTVFIRTQEGEGDLDTMEPTSETGGKKSDEDYKLAPGAIVGLGEGESIETANPNRPNTGFDPFVEAILRQIGVALELPFEILIKHFTASYSAARAALLEAWKFFSTRRTWLANNFCQPVFEAWMDDAVSQGIISAPGYFTSPIMRRAYLGSEWIGPAKGMIDEKKEIEAAKMRVEMGVSTLAEETAQLTGGDWEKKHPQRVKEHTMRKSAGLIEMDSGEALAEPEDETDDKGDLEDETS